MGRNNKVCTGLGLLLNFAIFLSTVDKIRAHSANPIPYGWEKICNAEEDSEILEKYVDNGSNIKSVTHIRCLVSGADLSVLWKFQTLRDWLQTMEAHKLVSVFLSVKCIDKGTISFPWPMKSYNLVGLKVNGCRLTGKYDDFGNKDVEGIPEYLRVLEIRDSTWISDPGAFERITKQENLANITSEYDCGQDSSLEVLITSNVSDHADGLGETLSPGDDTVSWNIPISPLDEDIKVNGLDLLGEIKSVLPSDVKMNETAVSALAQIIDHHSLSNSTTQRRNVSELFNLNSTASGGLNLALSDSEAMKEIENLLNTLQSLEIKCNFKKLRILDESVSNFMPVFHFAVMLQGSAYPELQLMNYSHTGMRAFPQELKEFRKNFPKLKYLDLSHNYISEIDLYLPTNGRDNDDDNYLTINIQGNRITNLTLETLLDWAELNDVFIDIRGNPIHCGKKVHELALIMQKASFFKGNLSRYEYIQNLECFSPDGFAGVKIADLVSRRKATGLSSAEVAIIASCGVGVLVVAVIVVAVIMFMLRRKDRKNISMIKKHPPALKSDSTKGIVNDVV